MLGASAPRRLLLLTTRHRCRRAGTVARASAALPPPLPGLTRVAVLTGFLGAGKTTTLARLLAGAGGGGRGGGRTRFPDGVRVVVNDVGAANVDAALLAAAGFGGGEDTAAVTPLTAGCACCTLADELTAAVGDAAADAACRWLLVECTGIASPGPVAAAVAAAGDDVDLAAVVAVVDATTFADAVAGRRGAATAAAAGAAAGAVVDVGDAGGDDDGGDDHASVIAELLADQVEGADVVLINKADVAPPAAVAAAAAAAAALNPGAAIHVTTRGELPDDALAGARGRALPGWVAALDAAAAARRRRGAAAAAPSHTHHHHHHHRGAASPTDRGASPPAAAFATFAYHAPRPFHPARLLAALEAGAPWAGVLRSKGFFWLATRPSIAGAWQAAGGGWAGEPSHAWRPGSSSGAAAPAPANDIVFIGGPAMDAAAVTAALDGALLTDDELGAGEAAWAAYDDPLPAWEVEEE